MVVVGFLLPLLLTAAAAAARRVELCRLVRFVMHQFPPPQLSRIVVWYGVGTSASSPRPPAVPSSSLIIVTAAPLSVPPVVVLIIWLVPRGALCHGIQQDGQATLQRGLVLGVSDSCRSIFGWGGLVWFHRFWGSSSEILR